MKSWLLAGSPSPHWHVLVTCLLAFLYSLEQFLPHVDWVKANSSLEAIGNVLAKLFPQNAAIAWLSSDGVAAATGKKLPQIPNDKDTGVK